MECEIKKNNNKELIVSISLIILGGITVAALLAHCLFIIGYFHKDSIFFGEDFKSVAVFAGTCLIIQILEIFQFRNKIIKKLG